MCFRVITLRPYVFPIKLLVSLAFVYYLSRNLRFKRCFNVPRKYLRKITKPKIKVDGERFQKTKVKLIENYTKTYERAFLLSLGTHQEMETSTSTSDNCSSLNIRTGLKISIDRRQVGAPYHPQFPFTLRLLSCIFGYLLLLDLFSSYLWKDSCLQILPNLCEGGRDFTYITFTTFCVSTIPVPFPVEIVLACKSSKTIR